MAKKSNKSQNGPVNNGIPFGSMVPPADLSMNFNGLATAETRLMVTREELRKGIGTFYTSFMKKYPKAGLADFARQFSKDVPFKRETYRVDRTYMTLQNMFKAYPELKTGGKAESKAARDKRISAMKQEAAKKRQARVEQQNRAYRLLACIVHQVGFTSDIFTVAAQRCGFSTSEVESILSTTGGLTDIGLGVYQLVIRASGVPAVKAAAAAKVKSQTTKQSVPTAAEVASAAKSAPSLTQVASKVPASKPKDVAVSDAVASASVKNNPSSYVMRASR